MTEQESPFGPGTETTPTPAWLSTLNGADLQNAASGEAPVSNGDGTFSMAAAGGGSGGSVVVTDGANLQDAINNNPVVRIKGAVDVGSEEIEVPLGHTIHGHGKIKVTPTGFTPHGDYITSNIDTEAATGPKSTIVLNERSTLFGLAVLNTNPNGSAVRVSQEQEYIRHCEIFAGKHGVHDFVDSNNNDDPTVEPHILNNTITSPNDQDHAVVLFNHTDGEIKHNIIRGFGNDATDPGQIYCNKDSNYISDNHMFAYPNDAGQLAKNIVVEGNSIITQNYLEGQASTCAIHAIGADVIVSNNECWVGDGADAVQISLVTDRVVNIQDNFGRSTNGKLLVNNTDSSSVDTQSVVAGNASISGGFGVGFTS